MRLRPILALLLLLIAVTGCTPWAPPPGLHDVVLVYSEPDRTEIPWVLTLRLQNRFRAFGIDADVTTSDDGQQVEVIVNEAHWRSADRLMKRPVGLTARVLEPHPSIQTSPKGAMRQADVTLPSDAIEHTVDGTLAAVGEIKLSGSGLQSAFERLDEQTARFHAVHVQIIANQQVPFDSLTETDDGRGWTVKLDPSFVAAIASRDPHEDIAIVLQDAVLAVVDRNVGPTLHIGFGNDLYAYRAAKKKARELLQRPTPSFASMVGPVPRQNVPLFALSVLVPFVLSLALLVFVRRFDRAFPEPRWIVVLTFLAGCLATQAAAYIEHFVFTIYPFLRLSVITKAGHLGDLPLAWLTGAIAIGLVEEGLKLLPVLFVTRRREFDEPIDGIVYASASALGFAALENVGYLFHDRLGIEAVVGRGFIAAPGHIFLSAIWGYALGRRLVRPGRGQIVIALFLSAAAHGLYDTLCEMHGPYGWCQVSLACVFIVLVRQSLRYGPIPREATHASGEATRSFAMGNRSAFVVAFVIMIALVGCLDTVAGNPVASRLVVLLESAGVVFGIVMAAWAVTASLPLDAVIRGSTITFAGAVRDLATIRKVVKKKDKILLRSDHGDMSIGPGPSTILEELATELRRISKHLRTESHKEAHAAEGEPPASSDSPRSPNQV